MRGLIRFQGTELDLMVGHNGFHGTFTALNSLAAAALMGPRCNSEKDPRDGRRTNILFLIYPARRDLCEVKTHLELEK